MERHYQQTHQNAAYIFKEMNRYADEQQANWQRRIEGRGNDCAVCLEPLPIHPWLGDQGQLQMLCCGNRICKDCDDQRSVQMKKLDKKFAGKKVDKKEFKKAEKVLNCCVMCREPLPTNQSTFRYKDGKNALEKYFDWSKKGRGWASYSIAKRYSEGGDGLPRNVKKAYHYFTLAAEQGDNKGMTDLGVVYIEGEGCKRDLVAAKKWLEAATECENAKAMCYLSFFLSSDEYGFELDMTKAKALLLRSAELGFPQAQEKAGAFYWKGERGFDVDLTKAIHWLTRAANQGEVNSMMALGTVLLEDAESRLGIWQSLGILHYH